MAIVQTRRGEAGTIGITVTSEGLQSATVELAASTAPLMPIIG